MLMISCSQPLRKMHNRMKKKSLKIKYHFRTTIYLFAVFLLASLNSLWLIGMIDFAASNPFVSILWTLGFVVVAFNISYMLANCLVSLFFKDEFLNEKGLKVIPKAAIIYVVRNEDGEILFQNISSSLENSAGVNADIWLLSNSDTDDKLTQEQIVVFKLRQKYGEERVGYFRSKENPLGRKHVCIQKWLRKHPDYEYMIVCDADSELPQGSMMKLLSKAEHPDNNDIVVFQSHITVEKTPTYFAKLLAFGQDICQRIFTRANQKVFGRSVCYGSGCLIRCREFSQIDVPDWVLSHDIWDTIFLEERGHRVVFCGDVVTCGGFPSDYIEYIKRNRRWINGTLESALVAFRKRVPIATRFMVLYPIYTYLCQPIFFLWILSGFFLDSEVCGTLLSTQRYALLGASYIDLEMGGHILLTLIIVYCYRFIKCKSPGEIGLAFLELVTSLIMCLNGIIFDSIAVLNWFVIRKQGRRWIPMQKKFVKRISFAIVVKNLWPASLLGIIVGAFGYMYSPSWFFFTSPFLLSFTLSIPVAFFTGKQVMH